MIRSTLKWLLIGTLLATTSAFATIHQKMSFRGLTQQLGSDIVPICGSSVSTDIHCTLLIYKSNIPSISLNEEIAAGTHWNGTRCQNTQQIEHRFLPWGFKKIGSWPPSSANPILSRKEPHARLSAIKLEARW